jgi:hypothetical protein
MILEGGFSRSSQRLSDMPGMPGLRGGGADLFLVSAVGAAENRNKSAGPRSAAHPEGGCGPMPRTHQGFIVVNRAAVVVDSMPGATRRNANQQTHAAL